jgi:hypothetical protein
LRRKYGGLDNYKSVKVDYGSNWGAVQTLIIRSERRLKRKKNERIGAETSGRKKRLMDVYASLGMDRVEKNVERKRSRCEFSGWK